MYPAFMAEMALPANRHKLWFGIGSGYAVAAAFLVFALAGHLQGLVAVAWPLYLLIGVKLITNSVAALSLRSDRLVLEANGLNTAADVVLMTCAIYLTGGSLSPLFSIYVIEITVVALLTNLGVTALVGGFVVLCYSTMSLLVSAGVLPQQAQPIDIAGGEVTLGYAITDLGGRVLVLGALTLFVGLILRMLRDRERRLAARTAQLLEAGEEKARFMANLTHELRTPIHGICGLSELVGSGVYGPVSEKQRAASEKIIASARNLLLMVDDLLELSKGEAGKLEVSLESVDVAEAVPELVASTRWMLGTVEMTVEHQVEPGLPPLVTDRGKLNQILINLLSNAVKFTPEGGRVILSARAEDGGVRFEVADTGRGIPASQLSAIFDEFRQLDGTMEREYGGVGLGLALVKRLVALLGGTIDVDSEVGAGTTFAVWLPGELAGE